MRFPPCGCFGIMDHIRSKLPRTLAWLALLCAWPALGQLPTSVDISVVASGTPGKLDMRVRPNGAAFNGMVDISWTVRWNAISPAHIGTVVQACTGAGPIGQGPLQTSGGNAYTTLSWLTFNPLSSYGCSWPADLWTTIATVTVDGNVGCTLFAIANDAYTAAHNGDFYCALNGIARTGTIVAPGASLCAPDCNGTLNGPAVPGAACNDGSPCTANDVWTTNCVCTGTFQDADGDGACDANDGCPNDPQKIAPGTCGCGTSDVDTDGDGTADCIDPCPAGPNPGTSCDDNNPDTYNDVITGACTCAGSPGCRLNGKVFLEGPYSTVSGRMEDHLRSQGSLPQQEPYTAMGYAFVGGGGETAGASVFSTSNPNRAKVDWIVVELRSAVDPTIVVTGRAALLCKDGTITDQLGDTPLRLQAPPGNYYVVVRHRNHLAVMTAAPITFALGSIALLDLTLAGTATYGTNARKTVGSVQVLWAGDSGFDGRISYTGPNNDRDPLLTTVGSTTPNNVVTNTYSTKDLNMDGTVRYTGTDNDRDLILLNVGSTTPNEARIQQVP